MNDDSARSGIEKYLELAREFLSPDKIRQFEEAYLRMKAKADRGRGPPPLPGSTDTRSK